MSSPQTNSSDLQAPTLRPFAQLFIEVGEIVDICTTPNGQRRMVAISGGRCITPDWQARVLPLGADFQWLLNDRVAQLDARYALETDAGDRIFVHNTALRTAEPAVMARLLRGEPVDPCELYFRCAPRFEAAAPSLRWLMERMFVGTGARRPAEVELKVFELM